MNSSTGMPSIVGGRGTRFCLPLMNTIIVFFFRFRRMRRCSAVSGGRGRYLFPFFFLFDLDIPSPFILSADPSRNDSSIDPPGRSAQSPFYRQPAPLAAPPLAAVRRVLNLPTAKCLPPPDRRACDLLQ